MNVWYSIRHNSTTVKKAVALHPSITAPSGQMTLPELIGRYPKFGNSMKVYKKTWPEDTYWKIMHVTKKTPKSIRYYGIKYE